MTRRIGVLTCGAILVLTAGIARAQTATTCAFDPGTALVTVAVDGRPAQLRAVASSGEIWLNGVSCGGATVFNTDTIQVSGGSRADDVSLSGTFAPGLTPETTGGSEIEISFSLGPDSDEVIVNLGGGHDLVVFTGNGIDVGNDGDGDILTAGTANVRVNSRGGNDRIDASAYSSVAPFGTSIWLYGGPGRDVLIGSTITSNWLFGEADDDLLVGGDSLDVMTGGSGDDRMVGNGGPDVFGQGATIDGADDMQGGEGFDEANYFLRTNGVTVTIGGTEPDGEPGEGDSVHADVEKIQGGYGPDVLVGNGLANVLQGSDGDDEVYGGEGNDELTGGRGNDIVVGDGGADTLRGEQGNDFLDGGLGADLLRGDANGDVLHGGPDGDTLDGGGGPDEYFGDGGNDTFVNADAFAETVDCGAGTADDPQPSALDTFIACEQI